MSFSGIARALAVVAAIVLATVIIRESGLATGPDQLKLWVDQEIRGHGLYGSLLFIAAGVLITGVGLSRQVLSFVAGYAFGVTVGTTLALLGSIGGVCLAFFYARFIGRDVVSRRYPSRVRQADAFLHDNPFLMTLAVRLLPISNNLVVNLVAGVSRVPAAPFFLASAVGHFPQTLVFALVGSGLAQGALAKGALATMLFIVSFLIGIYLYRTYRHGRDFDPSTAAIDE